MTSREAILSKCRQIMTEQGLSAINMRTVAGSLGIAVGSLYHYFPSKTDLISAAVEDVWRDIFHMPGETPAFASFPACLAWIFTSIQTGCSKYPGFFTFHSVSFAAGDKEKGRRMMETYFGHMKKSLLHVLDQDPDIRPDAFDALLSKEDFVEFVFTSFTSMLLKEQTNYGPLLEIVKRCIY